MQDFEHAVADDRRRRSPRAASGSRTSCPACAGMMAFSICSSSAKARSSAGVFRLSSCEIHFVHEAEIRDEGRATCLRRAGANEPAGRRRASMAGSVKRSAGDSLIPSPKADMQVKQDCKSKFRRCAGSKRLEHDQQHDRDHHQGRHSLIMRKNRAGCRLLPWRQILCATAPATAETRSGRGPGQLGPDPASLPIDQPGVGQQQAPKTQVATIAGVMIPRSSRRSMTLNIAAV